MSESPPPQVMQLRGLLCDMWERWCDGKKPTSEQIRMALALCDSLIARYPELTEKQ